jgi:murein DD-endopeptidase MepM/ murein hydrolase activator NlpD
LALLAGLACLALFIRPPQQTEPWLLHPGGVPPRAVEVTELPEFHGDRVTGPARDLDPAAFRLSDTGPELQETADPEVPATIDRMVRVGRGDTLIDLFRNAGVARAEAHEATAAMAAVFDPRALRPGQEITLSFAPAADGEASALLGLSLEPHVGLDISVSRDSDGRFTAAGREAPIRRKLVRLEGHVRSSLFEAGAVAGVPGTIMVELFRVFAYDVDFQRDVQPGDSFEVMFERFVDPHGRIARDGAILFGALTLSGERKRVYRFVDRQGNAEYFTANGESVRKALLRTPIDGARLSSGFGNRKHPILGYTALHRGVDFAAPTGTPIQAAGDGVVEHAGANGAYGNYVRVRHTSEYATAYAHMSRIANLKPGMRVRQGQVIGYVGSTGRSTGPHLHYEIIRRGAQVNPLGVKMPVGQRLEAGELTRFRFAAAEIDLRVAEAENEAKRLAAAR